MPLSLPLSLRIDLTYAVKVPVVSTTVGAGRAINKLQWDRKEGRRAALGGSDGRLYIYDIGDMALPRETEWTDMQKTLASIVGGGGGGGGQPNGVAESDPTRIIAGR
jgi:dynein intermediate chain, cytosolic